MEAVGGDFFGEPLPEADVITMGMILHDWNLERKKQLVKAAYDALPEGGAYIVIENIIDDARRENAFGLLMSPNMLIEFGDAFDFTGADFAAWCKEAGFREIEVLRSPVQRAPASRTSSAVIASRVLNRGSDATAQRLPFWLCTVDCGNEPGQDSNLRATDYELPENPSRTSRAVPLGRRSRYEPVESDEFKSTRRVRSRGLPTCLNAECSKSTIERL